EIIPLPQTTAPIEQLVYPSSGISLPTSGQVFKKMVWILHKDCVHMIWHHDRRNQSKAFTIKMTKRLSDYRRTIWATKNTRPVAGVEPSLDRAGEAFVIFSFNLTAPWLGVKTKPNFALALPLRAQMGGNCIEQS